MVAQIRCTGGEVVLVDDTDLPLVEQHAWTVIVTHRGKAFSRQYAGNTRAGTTVYMHRLILNAQPGFEVDHRDGNTLDNRRSNLRLATRSQNQANRGKPRGHYSSQYKGVSRSTRGWVAQMTVDGKGVFIGLFATEVEAAKGYDAEILKHFGEFAFLNFPIFKSGRIA